MNVENGKTDAKMQEIKRITQLEPSRERDISNRANRDAPKMDIDPQIEVTGIKSLLTHTGICLCTFLIGLVSGGFKAFHGKIRGQPPGSLLKASFCSRQHFTESLVRSVLGLFSLRSSNKKIRINILMSA